MQQSEFEWRRNELIRRYRLSIQPLYQRYLDGLSAGSSDSWRNHTYETLQAELKPHLEVLFNQIARLKRREC